MSSNIKNETAKQSITKAAATRHCDRWTDEQDAQLISMLGEKTYVQIGIEMGRTYHSIHSRVDALKFRGVIDREIITVPWQPTEVQGVGQYTIKELEQRVKNYNEKYTRACQERDGFREQMLTAQQQEQRVRKQVAEIQADFIDYKDATLASLRCVEKQSAELTTRNQELLASGRVMEDSIKNQAARLRLAESENDRLRRREEGTRELPVWVVILILFVCGGLLGGLLL